MCRPVFSTLHHLYSGSSNISMVPPTVQCCCHFHLVCKHCRLCLLDCLHLKCKSISMTTMSVCRQACIAAPRNETSHESLLGVTDAGRAYQQCTMDTCNHRCYLLTSVKPADQNHIPEHIKHWATSGHIARLESFTKCCRSALLEAGVHKGSVRGNVAVNMHGPEHPASCCQVPSA